MLNHINEHTAVMRFSALGDIAGTIPTLRALSVKPTIITTAIGKELLKDEYENFIILKDKKVFSILSLILRIRKEKFKILLDFQCNDRSRFISKFSNAKVFNNHLLDTNHSTNIFFDIAKQANIVQALDTTFIPKEKSYIVLNCGSSPKWISKRLPFEKWHQISTLLYERYHLPFLLTGDTLEKEYIEEVAQYIVGTKEVVAGKTTIQELKKILKDAFLTVSTDSAPMHIAAVQKTPTIGLFGPTNWIRSAPYGPWSVAIYDTLFYADSIPPKRSMLEQNNYFSHIDITPALDKLSPYLGSS